VTRWWSGGDSNWRSSLWFLALRKRLEVSARATTRGPIRELFSQRICWQIRAENGATSTLFQGAKRQKRTGGSNPLRSSNEAVLTAGPFCSASHSNRLFPSRHCHTVRGARYRDGWSNFAMQAPPSPSDGGRVPNVASPISIRDSDCGCNRWGPVFAHLEPAHP
jgi:hypothetical protein